MEAKSVQEIVDMVNREVAEAKAKRQKETPVAINTGTLYGGQHVSNVVINGDYVPGNKQGGKKGRNKK
ncbi:hypothetical protein TU94_28340 [Streptomyces cyaneogriseus subsp. noncyanogenus]|uniref:Uncharacterized protein n=1 Tax=Streptomyces cyaneogriseus subsp. noncyanogenus TaxID=477245 RepID=A0A0C5G7N7_9ACTN|nr:hypothetical protein [Streptomyces cyaneogriseus]AJP04775.1 hypothetical protein TU94_28340 [Streptomyces cyaneogriseus subsp. noncyanogenus]